MEVISPRDLMKKNLSRYLITLLFTLCYLLSSLLSGMQMPKKSTTSDFFIWLMNDLSSTSVSLKETEETLIDQASAWQKTTRAHLQVNTQTPEIVATFLNTPIPQNNGSSYTYALHIAIKHSTPEKLQLLLDYGALSSLPDSNGDIPLHLSIKLKKDALTLILLKHDHINRLTINFPDKFGRTPLFLACYLNEPALINILFDMGANPESIATIGGKEVTPRAIATQKDCGLLIEELILRRDGTAPIKTLNPKDLELSFSESESSPGHENITPSQREARVYFLEKQLAEIKKRQREAQEYQDQAEHALEEEYRQKAQEITAKMIALELLQIYFLAQETDEESESDEPPPLEAVDNE